jgi:hypothetical protein
VREFRLRFCDGSDVHDMHISAADFRHFHKLRMQLRDAHHTDGAEVKAECMIVVGSSEFKTIQDPDFVKMTAKAAQDRANARNANTVSRRMTAASDFLSQDWQTILASKLKKLHDGRKADAAAAAAAVAAAASDTSDGCKL